MPLGLFLCVPALLLSILAYLVLPSSSVSFSYFILAVPMQEFLVKHSCTSSTFPIAKLNGPFFFRYVKAMNNCKLRAIKQTLLNKTKGWLDWVIHPLLWRVVTALEEGRTELWLGSRDLLLPCASAWIPFSCRA